MAIDDNDTRDQYTATSSQAVFPYTFEIFDDYDAAVEQSETSYLENILALAWADGHYSRDDAEFSAEIQSFNFKNIEKKYNQIQKQRGLRNE